MAVLLSLLGCVSNEPGRNPFLALTETFGIAAPSDDDDDGGGTPGGGSAEGEFRRAMNITFRNNNPRQELNTSLVAWVELSSIRSAEQQDALLTGGYRQLTSEIRIGTVFTLPPGTFVFNGPGTAGATSIVLRGPEQPNAQLPTERTISLITPDVVLVFSEPPASCDSLAFYYTLDGDVPGAEPVGLDIFDSTTNSGPRKTLSQIDVYGCQPLKPGLFLKLGGGVRAANEYLEGENATFDFNAVPDPDGNFATVTIS